jgi:hypothetical protein
MAMLGTQHAGRGDRALKAAAALYGVGLVIHTIDHFRRGTGVISREVFWAGTVSIAVAVATVVLAFIGHRLAPLVAATAALPVGIGVAAVHLLPHWSVFSDAFPGGAVRGVNALSWTAVLLEIAGAVAVGLLGIAMLRRESGSIPARA